MNSLKFSLSLSLSLSSCLGCVAIFSLVTVNIELAFLDFFSHVRKVLPKDCLAKKEPTEVVNRSLSKELSLP
jgi:hypothetical protein